MNSVARVTDTRTLLEFMVRLGQAYIASGEQTAKVELILRRLALAYGLHRARVVAFPTAIFISLHDGKEEHVTLAEGPTQSLRLDQIAEVYTLGQAYQKGEAPLQDGLTKLNAILRKKPRFGVVGAVVGHAILSYGLAVLLTSSFSNHAVAAALGAIVGILKLSSSNRPVLALPLPVVAAALVSTLVFMAVRYGLQVDPFHALVPPLVTFLPGAMLTLGMEELAYGDMVSGASRLITGLVQLLLLTFGLVLGAGLVGYSPDYLLDSTELPSATTWAPWAGVVVFGIGVYLHFSAPQKSFLWILFVLLVTFATRQLSSEALGTGVSGFFGMLVASLLGYSIQWQFRGPPSMTTILPSFWLLVPGALGLVSIKRMLSDRIAGIDGLITVMLVLTAIALGSLVGASLYKWLSEHYRWWRLQLSRARRYLQRRSRR